MGLIFHQEALRDHALNHLGHSGWRDLHATSDFFITDFFYFCANFINALEVIFFVWCHAFLFSSLTSSISKKSSKTLVE